MTEPENFAEVDDEPINYMNIEEFRSEGYLTEVNRRVLHPLGLALEVDVNDAGEWVLSGVWDYRDDPEGIRYEGPALEAASENASHIAQIEQQRRPVREATLGYFIQDVEPE